MEDFIPLSYKYFFSDDRPNVDTLLHAIPTKPLLFFLCKINFELYFEPSNSQIQYQLLDNWLKGISAQEKEFICGKIITYIELVKDGALFFSKRYLLEFINYLFAHYNDIPERILTPVEIRNTLIAYLVIVDECNDKDYSLLPHDERKLNLEELEQITWPFLLNQFECNHAPVHETEMVKLFAALTFIIKENSFKKYLDEYMILNGFASIGHLVNSAMAVITNQLDNYDNNTFHNRYPILYASGKVDRLENLSLNHRHFQQNKDKNIYYKLLKERPLLKLHENDYAIIDFAFLKGKIYTGFLFDLYYETSFKTDPVYPKFDHFKSIISKKVVEENIFTKLLQHIFINEGVVPYYEANESISIPDCYCRIGNIIYFIEFKDYLLRGDIFQSYLFTEIIKAIDIKFIRGTSGIPQIKEQLTNFLNKDFEFDKSLDYAANLTIYPLIVHTNFALSCPGIQQYLNKQLRLQMADMNVPSNITIKELVLMDLNVFLLHYNNLKENNRLLATLIEKYFVRSQELIAKFDNKDNPSPMDYATAYQSFDMEYFFTFKKEAIPHQTGFMQVIKEITGASQSVMNYPCS